MSAAPSLVGRTAKAVTIGLEICDFAEKLMDNCPDRESQDPGDQSAIAAG